MWMKGQVRGIYQHFSHLMQLKKFIQASTDSLNWDWCIREQNEVGELFHGHTSTIDWHCNYCGKSNEALSSTLKMDIRDRQALLSYAIKEIEEKILPNLQTLLWVSRRMSWYCCALGVESGKKICQGIFLPLFHSMKKLSMALISKENKFQQDARSVHRVILWKVEDSVKHILGYYLGYHNACCDILAL